VNHGRYVVFVTGKGPHSALVLLDAKAPTPSPIFVPPDVKKGNEAVTPFVATTAEGKAFAFVFHDHPKDVDVENMLEIVALGPKGDGECRDAKVVKSLKVGQSAVEGHYGHHAVAFDADGRFAFFSNPGDGTISVLSLKTLEIVASFDVGGTPTTVIARGGRESKD
jgi:DNA-binding beta-propeller fold protein YncE